jgi:hypothetical protein
MLPKKPSRIGNELERFFSSLKLDFFKWQSFNDFVGKKNCIKKTSKISYLYGFFPENLL